MCLVIKRQTKWSKSSCGFLALNFFFHQRTCSDGVDMKQFHYFTLQAKWLSCVCCSESYPGTCTTACLSEHVLGLEHDDVQVGERLTVVNVVVQHFSNLQGGSSTEHLHLSQEACAARLSVYPAQQEVSLFTPELDHALRSPRSVAWTLGCLQSHLKAEEVVPILLDCETFFVFWDDVVGLVSWLPFYFAIFCKGTIGY